MKKILALLCLGLALPMVRAQETNEVEQLKQQLQQVQEKFEKERNEDRQLIQALSQKVNDLLKQTQAATTSAPPPVATAPPDAEKAKLEAER